MEVAALYFAKDSKLERLKKLNHNKRTISADDVQNALGLKRSSAQWLLSNWATTGKITRISRGIYSLEKDPIPSRQPRLSPEIENGIHALHNEGVTFVLTGLDILFPFVQHQPNRILHLLYTASGAGSWAQSLIKSDQLTPLLEPEIKEIETAIDLIGDRSEIVIIRERNSLHASKNSLATLERAFIDLYLESSRNLIPFSVQEVAYIFLNMRSAVTLNTVQMLRYAKDRSIREEIDSILRALSEPTTHFESSHAETFIKILENIR